MCKSLAGILVIGMLALGCSKKVEQPMERAFVPATFRVPEQLNHSEFRLRPLEVSDAAADYEAVMESKVELRRLFGGDWPQDGFTLEQNRSDLEAHRRAFLDRESFTYTVLTPDGLRIVGCVYIHPGEGEGAQVIYWIRTSEQGRGLSEKLQHVLHQWLTSEWPFRDVVFPGRE